MATNAFGVDFWIGRVFRSKDKREEWRHVIIADIRGGAAKCHNLIYGSPGKMNSHFSWISLKALATRWTTCKEGTCTYCNAEPAGEAKGSES